MHISWVVLQMWNPHHHPCPHPATHTHTHTHKTLTTCLWACSPRAYWSLRIDSTLLPHHQPIRELCTSWSQTLGCPSFTWPLKMLCWTLSRVQGLGGHKLLFLLAWPGNKLWSALTLIFWFVWHTNLGLLTWTRTTFTAKHPVSCFLKENWRPLLWPGGHRELLGEDSLNIVSELKWAGFRFIGNHYPGEMSNGTLLCAGKCCLFRYPSPGSYGGCGQIFQGDRECLERKMKWLLWRWWQQMGWLLPFQYTRNVTAIVTLGLQIWMSVPKLWSRGCSHPPMAIAEEECKKQP